MSPRKKGPKRDVIQSRVGQAQNKTYYEEQIRKAERLICSGITSHREIAIALGKPCHEVDKICKTIYQRWRDDPNQDVQDRRQLRCKQLEVVLQKAHSAFERSCKDVEEFSTKQSVCRACNGRKQFKDDTTASGYSDCKSCNGVGMIITEEVTIRKKVGDPAFLHLAKEVVKELAKIDGIITEKKVTVNNTLVHQSMTLGGEVEQSVRELYSEAPIETLMKAKLLLEELDLAEQKKLAPVKSQPGVVVVDKS
jgi:hypothetical protein